MFDWLVSSPCQFKTFVGKRVLQVIELISPERGGMLKDNSVDCASRGLLSTELLENELPWSGPGYPYRNYNLVTRVQQGCNNVVIQGCNNHETLL